MNDIFDTHADDYSEEIDKTLNQYGASHEFFMQHKAWLIEDLLKKFQYQASELDLLDVGCGVGKLHSHIKGKFKSIAGIDVSKGAIEVARKVHPDLRYEAYDGHRIPCDDGSIDMTLAVGVFHHVPPDQWNELAFEMLRVLKPGGLSLVIEHNPYNPVTRRIVNTCPIDEGVVLLKPSKLGKLFTDAGGREVHTRTILSVPPKTGFLKKIDGFFGHLPFGAQYYMIARKSDH